MFVLLISSFYNFLIGPDGKGPDRFVDIFGVMMMAISISGAPSLILGVVSFGLSKNYGNKLTAILLLSAGIVFVIGMIISLFRVVSIPNEFFHSMLVIVPYIFLPVGIIIFILGILLFRSKKKGNER